MSKPTVKSDKPVEQLAKVDKDIHHAIRLRLSFSSNMLLYKLARQYKTNGQIKSTPSVATCTTVLKKLEANPKSPFGKSILSLRTLTQKMWEKLPGYENKWAGVLRMNTSQSWAQAFCNFLTDMKDLEYHGEYFTGFPYKESLDQLTGRKLNKGVKKLSDDERKFYTAWAKQFIPTIKLL